MTLTPEQFNKLVTKEEHNELKAKVDKMDNKLDKLLEAVEGITTQHKTFVEEMLSNQVAHDRFESRIKVLENKAV